MAMLVPVTVSSRIKPSKAGGKEGKILLRKEEFSN